MVFGENCLYAQYDPKPSRPKFSKSQIIASVSSALKKVSWSGVTFCVLCSDSAIPNSLAVGLTL